VNPRRGIWLLLILFACLALSALAGAATPDYYLFSVTPPDGVAPLAGPEAMCFDRLHHELYVADAGNSRILIFDRDGNYLFEFSDRERLSSPRAIDVDSLGRIYVLTAHPDDQIHRFDYDGTFLGDIRLAEISSDSTISASSFVLGNEGRLFVLETDSARIHVLDPIGSPLYSFSLLDSSELREERPIIGQLAWIHDRLVVPMSMFAQVQIHAPDGAREKVFGMAGGTPGSFSFPVAACEDHSGGLLVLDKHRFTVLQFRMDGKWISELGGMGVSPGWFYHPHAICTDGEGQYFVAQTFMNRIQAIRFPRESRAPEARISDVSSAEPATGNLRK
jgi:hypothetical protein